MSSSLDITRTRTFGEHLILLCASQFFWVLQNLEIINGLLIIDIYIATCFT